LLSADKPHKKYAFIFLTEKMLFHLNGREQRKVKGKVGVVKRVVRGCCYAELEVKKEEFGVIRSWGDSLYKMHCKRLPSG